MANDLADRQPISTYEQALWRLVEHFAAHGPVISLDEPLPVVAEIVGEIFWVSPSRLRSDLLKCQREVHHSAPRRRYGGRDVRHS